MNDRHNPRRWSWPNGIPDSLNGGSAPLNPSSMPDRRPKEVDVDQALSEIRSSRNGQPFGLAAHTRVPISGETGQELLERQRRLALEAQGRR